MAIVSQLAIEIIEHEISPVMVTDARRQLGGKCLNGVLRIRTTDGVEGQAIIGAFGDDPTWAIDRIVNQVGPALLHRDSADREWLWGKLDALTGHDLPTEPAWAWVDLALWDLAGKQAQLPVCELLGVGRQSISVLATYPPRHRNVEGFLDEALELSAFGCAALKIHPGPLTTRQTLELLGRLKAETRNTELVLDANNSYNLDDALLVGRGLDGLGVGWFEDPIPASHWDGLRFLQSEISTPIAVGDESSILVRESLRILIEHRLRVIRCSSRKLGITGTRRVISFAESLDRRCEFGVGGNPSANAANLHLACSANSGYYEHWLPNYAQEFGAVANITPSRDGIITRPTAAGLGVDLDEEWIDAHRIETLFVTKERG